MLFVLGGDVDCFVFVVFLIVGQPIGWLPGFTCFCRFMHVLFMCVLALSEQS